MIVITGVEEEGTTGIWWIEAGDAAQNFIAHRIAIPSLPLPPAQTKYYLIQNINSAKVEKPLDTIAITKYLKGHESQKRRI